MENITKALYMAAGVLIGLLVLSAFVWVFSNGGKFLASFEDEGNIKQVEQFNAELLAYQKEDNTIYDIVSAINKAKDINEQYLPDESNCIQIKLGSTIILEKDNDLLVDLIEDLIKVYGQTTENDTSYRYRAYFTGTIHYNEQTGKIDKIEFIQN